MAQITLPIPQEIGPLFTVNFKSIGLTAAQFEQLCSDNRDLRLELTFEGELIVMPPAGSKTGLRNARLNQRLANWADIDGTGACFDSSTGFTLPNGAKYSPDSGWVRRDRWDALTTEEQEGFAPICPDFVIELRSPSDSVSRLKNKMQEYIENGALLAWLIDPLKRQVYIYRPDHDVEVLEDSETVSGEPLLRGFLLNLHELW
ncbi:MAG: Uma2 family endonuclease [Acidobacteriota bacterium]|nr:Uma2 family endonuclease [Acidobacteriota bacterium]